MLTLQETFSCAVEFCKLHSEFFDARYKTNLSYAVGLLESMKQNPELYRDEWKCWNTAVNDKVHKYMNDEGFFSWDDEPFYILK